MIRTSIHAKKIKYIVFIEKISGYTRSVKKGMFFHLVLTGAEIN